MSNIEVTISGDWTARELPVDSGGRRGATAAEELVPAALLEPAGLQIVAAHELTATARRGAEPTGRIELTVEGGEDEHFVLAIRHDSGALTFHPCQSVAARRGTDDATIVRFEVELPRDDGAARRGIIGRIVRTIVLGVTGAIADRAVRFAARKWEQRAFRKRGLTEGLFFINAAGLAGAPLKKARAADFGPKDARCLLFIHGTFSNAADGFGNLVANSDTTTFDALALRYEGRVFAYNHFSVSKTPEENAVALLGALPKRPHEFDVITHSRGALVLRSIVEGLGSDETVARFTVRRAVLVAAPNGGTPLATPDHWDQTVSWLANVSELLPPGPLSLTLDFISNAVSWLAQRLAGSVPGIASMDSNGQTIAALQAPPLPPPNAYAALTSNYEPDGSFLRRAMDVGIDAFFGVANDLVVPTQGGWIVSAYNPTAIAPERIGCFGPGGNLSSITRHQVWHSDFFDEPATHDFLLRMLPTTLNDERLAAPVRRGEGRQIIRREPIRVELPQPFGERKANGQRVATERPLLAPESTFSVGESERRPPLQLTVVENPDGSTLLYAQYGNAMVMEPFRTKGQEKNAGDRFRRIIAMHERIIGYVNGKAGARLPSDAELIAYGTTLFETLFPGDVRRLYDVVRSIDATSPLDVVLTSMTPWIADKPWEFAYDPARRTYLATEEIHFTRNVVTAVPADYIPEKASRLRILVVVAQPVGTGRLSSDAETRVIRRGFKSLVEAGLAIVDVLTSATAGKLHDAVRRSQYDVVHFIGHGEYDAHADKGYLLFENNQGGVQRLGDRQVREILCGRSIRLVFFNACETGRGGRADFNSGVAPALVAGGVPNVIANQYSVLDVSATVFAQQLYWSLACGDTIGEAAREARVAVNYSISGESIDWAVPVVYTRNPQMRLCSGVVATPDAFNEFGTRRSRRGAIKRRIEIGVWDINNQFPDIDKVLTKLNAVQDLFGYYSVYVSAPIGAIAASPEKGSNIRYLNAEEVAKRLRNQPSELGVDYLCCITDKYMRDSEWYNLYGWWDYEDDKSSLIFFSTAGFDLEPDTIETQKVLAKELAITVLHVRANIGTHRRGPKSCPLYFNEERDIAHLTDFWTLDSQCKSELKTMLEADEVEAIESMLQAFATLA